MAIIIETIVLCAVFFIFCFLGTDNDEKNIKSFRSYPDEVQKNPAAAGISGEI